MCDDVPQPIVLIIGEDSDSDKKIAIYEDR